MNYGPPDHLAPCFLDLNWNQPVGRPHSAENLASGQLGSTPLLENSAENLASGQLGSTPLSFPAMPFSADQGFVERAAIFSCFSSSQFGHMEAGKMSRDSSCQSLRVNGPQLEMPHTEDGNFPEESAAASDPASSEGNGKKRKTAPRGKGKETSKMFEGDDLDAKRCLPPKVEQNGSTSPTGKKQSKGKESNAEAAEPQKDYIHVRARRGQATDSHSLAERVRREKISERMKLLQDIVPGCNKVTGKAIMLDEIINYVQSLQRQVEFLSMKLASVDTIETTATPTLYSHLAGQGVSLQCSVNPLESLLHRTLDEFGNATSQLRNFWEDDLQNVMQMGYEQNQEIAFPSQGFHGM